MVLLTIEMRWSSFARVVASLTRDAVKEGLLLVIASRVKTLTASGCCSGVACIGKVQGAAPAAVRLQRPVSSKCLSQFWKRLKGENPEGKYFWVKTQRVNTSENFSEESNLPRRFRRYPENSIKSSKRYIFYLLRNLLKYLLRTFFSSAKFSEVFYPLRFLPSGSFRQF